MLSTSKRRIFLLGNGSSLKQTPKHLLQNETTMGCNRIAAWLTPSYYVKIDLSVFDARDWRSEVLSMVETGIPCLLWDIFRDGVKNPNDGFYQWVSEGIGNHPNITWVSRCEHHHYPPGYPKSAQTWHAPFCTAYNSISLMAQWAVQMGFQEINLLGCDLGFTDGSSDHFMPDYYERVDANYKERNNSHVMAAHQLIKNSCPVPVYNCTIGGALETYERRNIYEVLHG